MWTKIEQIESRLGMIPSATPPRALRVFQRTLVGFTRAWEKVHGRRYFIVIGLSESLVAGRTYRYTIERLDPDETTVEIKVDGKALAKDVAKKTKGAK